MISQINSMTHFNWGEEKKIEVAKRRSLSRFWQDLVSATTKYVAAANRDFDTDGLGFVLASSENELSITLGIFELKYLWDSQSAVVYFAFVSPILRTVRANDTDIWRQGTLHIGEYGVGSSSDIKFWSGTAWVSISDLTAEEIAAWPMADRIARWGLEKLIRGESWISVK